LGIAQRKSTINFPTLKRGASQHGKDLQMAQTLVSLFVHVIFSTKNRANLILPDDEPELYAYMAEF